MIRVAIIAGPLHSGGKKNLILEYYRHIDHTKFQLDIICNEDSNSIPYEEINALGGKIYVIPTFKNLFSHIIALWKVCKKNQYDIIHAYNSTMNLFPMAIGYYLGTKVRISESLSMAHKGEFKTLIKSALKPFSKLYATHYMACGKDCGIYQFGRKTFNENKIEIFKTAINTKINEYDKTLRINTRKTFNWENKIVYGFIGRFEKQKNPLFLIDIFNSIHKFQSQAVFVIIGAGKMEEKILNKIKQYNLKDYVYWLGRREDIKQFYNAFDAFILPSLYEGLPVVGLESQCSGLPIFFSTEITKEASACELAQYIDLKESSDSWAKKIIQFTVKNIPNRRSYSKEIANAGFDSIVESKRLELFYHNTLNGYSK